MLQKKPQTLALKAPTSQNALSLLAVHLTVGGKLITWKGKNRANSTQYANPWLQEAQTQKLWINPIDAQKRDIAQGDSVRIHNDRGVSCIPAEVTQRIMPGVVALQAGAWWQPDANGVDQAGCANVLSSARITALAKGNSHQTMLVEVAKA